MNAPQILVILIIAIPLLFASFNRLRIDIAALIIAVALGALQFAGIGILGAPHAPAEAVRAISGFSQPVILILISLFMITRALDKSGVTRWIVRGLLRISGRSETRLIFLFAATTALLSLFMNNLAAGALVLPSAMEAARRTGIKPSKLLIPVAYGSLLGGAATYFTTANIIVSNLLVIANPPQKPLNILDFTPTGGLIAILGIAYLAFVGHRLLPERVPAAEQLMARPTSSELEDYYQLGERVWEARVQPNSTLSGKSLAQAAIGEKYGLAVAAILQGDHSLFSPSQQQVIHAGDILLIVGREERVTQLAQQGLVIGREAPNGHISSRGVTFIEMMLAPHSHAEGQSLKELEFRNKYGFTAVAMWRKDRSYRTNVADFKLSLGDSFLMVGPPNRLKSLRNNPDFIILEPSLSDQPIQRRQATLAVATMFGAIAISIAGVPIYLAMLVGALLLILFKVITTEEAYQAVEWQAVFLIAGMYAASLAMVQTGLAELLGNGMVHLVQPLGPLGLAAGAYLLTALLTQVMGGQVTALVTGPIAISAAISLNANAQAVAVATAIGCSASFLTPLAHPVNVLMIAPANYRFGDFFRIGWGLTLICFVALIFGLLLFWGL